MEKAAILSRYQCVKVAKRAVQGVKKGVHFSFVFRVMGYHGITVILFRIKNGQNMMTSSNGNIFRVTRPLCGEFTGPGEFPTQRPVTRSFDVFFDLRLNKGLSKQPRGWWFETQSWSLWRHCNDITDKRDFARFFLFDLSFKQTFFILQRPCCCMVVGKCGCNLNLAIFISGIDTMTISCQIVFKWIPQDLTYD